MRIYEVSMRNSRLDAAVADYMVVGLFATSSVNEAVAEARLALVKTGIVPEDQLRYYIFIADVWNGPQYDNVPRV